MKRISPALTIGSVFLYIFLYAPIAVVIACSFNAARYGTEWSGFTTKWYSALLQNDLALSAGLNTFLLGLLSTGISTVLGTMLAYGMERYRFPGQALAARFLYLPVFIPDIVLAVALLLFYSMAREISGFFQPGLGTMVLGHVTFQIPFVAIVVRSRMAGLDPALQEAARDLGATRWQTFRHIMFPLIAPGIGAAAMLAFTLSLDDFVVSFFTSGPGSTTLPILIYSAVKRGVTPDINALSTLVILASIIGTVVLTLLQKRDYRQNQNP